MQDLPLHITGACSSSFCPLFPKACIEPAHPLSRRLACAMRSQACTQHRLACRIILSPNSCQGRSASADVCDEQPSAAGLVIELRAGHAGIR